MSRFGDRLRDLRIAKNMTQQALADKLGLNKQTISQYERGIRQPQIEMLEMMADIFNVDMNFLLGKEDLITRLINTEEYTLIENYRDSAPASISIQDENEAKLVRSYRKYNATGKAKLMDYVADLNDSPRNFGEVSDSSTDITEKDDSGSFGRRA